MVDRGEAMYSVTPESRAEDLRTWSDEQLLTLYETMTSEVADGTRYLRTIEEILAERAGVAIHERPEAFGERIELPPFED